MLFHAGCEFRASTNFFSHTHTSTAAAAVQLYSAAIYLPIPNTMWCSMIHNNNPIGILLPNAVLALAGTLAEYVCRALRRVTRVWGVLRCSLYLGASAFQLENVAPLSGDAHNAPLRPISVGGKVCIPQSCGACSVEGFTGRICLGDFGDLVAGRTDRINP